MFSQAGRRIHRVYLQQVWKFGSLRLATTSDKTTPFVVLGLSDKSTSYTDVKAAFVKLALVHHPDRSGGCKDEFMKVRRAFESIRELPDGSCALVDERDDYLDDDAMADWFFQETGQNLSFRMNAETRKEVAQAANMSQGGLDRGGMWEMARMIAREEEASPSKEEPAKLDAPENSATRRRRKR